MTVPFFPPNEKLHTRLASRPSLAPATSQFAQVVLSAPPTQGQPSLLTFSKEKLPLYTRKLMAKRTSRLRNCAEVTGVQLKSHSSCLPGGSPIHCFPGAGDSLPCGRAVLELKNNTIKRLAPATALSPAPPIIYPLIKPCGGVCLKGNVLIPAQTRCVCLS